MIPGMSTSRSKWRHLAAFCGYCWRRFEQDECLHSAAALTYMSLFAVVPLMTVIYATLSTMPAFAQVGEQLQDFIFEHFLPASGREVQTYLRHFSEQALTLTGWGAAFLFATALTMMAKIEKEFNGIWLTRGNRRGLSSFLLYWAILTLGPLCVGLAIGISTYVASLGILFDHVDIFGMRIWLLNTLPWLLTSAAFTLLFAAVPNCRVPFKHALAGGLLSGFCFEIAKHVFALVMRNTKYQLIYGAFAAVPLFLLWLYISWVIVLGGAEVVHALSGFSDQQARRIPRMVLALAVLERLWQRHQNGAALSERELLHEPWLLGRYTLSSERWAALRDQLIDAGLVKIAQDGKFVLGRDLNHYSLWQLCEQLGTIPPRLESGLEVSAEQHMPWLAHCRTLLVQLRENSQSALEVTLTQLFTSVPSHNETSTHDNGGAGPGTPDTEEKDAR